MRPYRSITLILVVVLVTPSALAAQRPSWLGRWVYIELPHLVLDFEQGGDVHSLMPAPQFAATYHLDGDHLSLRGGTRDWIDTSFSLRNDTVLVSRGLRQVTLSGNWHRSPGSGRGVQGTWRRSDLGASHMEAFLTLRSDSQVVLETGYPVQAKYRGDTLELVLPAEPLIPPNARTTTFVLRLVADTLRATDGNGTTRLLVRRQVGMFWPAGI